MKNARRAAAAAGYKTTQHRRRPPVHRRTALSRNAVYSAVVFRLFLNVHCNRCLLPHEMRLMTQRTQLLHLPMRRLNYTINSPQSPRATKCATPLPCRVPNPDHRSVNNSLRYRTLLWCSVTNHMPNTNKHAETGCKKIICITIYQFESRKLLLSPVRVSRLEKLSLEYSHWVQYRVSYSTNDSDKFKFILSLIFNSVF